MTDRLAQLVRALRAADEGREAIRRMIEHDLALRVPDAPEFTALRVIADDRLAMASDYLTSAHDRPEIDAVDSAIFCEQIRSIALSCAGDDWRTKEPHR